MFLFIILHLNSSPSFLFPHMRRRFSAVLPEGGERSVIVGFDDFVTHAQLEKRTYAKGCWESLTN